MPTFLLRYGEIALKGQNQPLFLEALTRNVVRAIDDLGPHEVRTGFGRIYVSIDADPALAVERLRKVFGIVSLSPTREVPPDLDAVKTAAVAMAEEALRRRPEVATFKVSTRRADKRFPLTSMELSREVGRAIQSRLPRLAARMRDPDLLVQIELRDRAYLATETVPGPGGLPYGTGGHVLALISGGIDSPVAAWYAARRGAVITAVHFHSFPFTSDRAREKVVDLCRVLAEYTGPLDLWVVHFTEIQRAVAERVPDAFRILVLRRMMMRIAERMARRLGAQALVTGESLGQVASQTLESLAAISAVTRLPVLRPLIGADKTEIMARASAIGTYAISIRPFEDCCSLFVPAHPRTQPTVEEVDRAEARLTVEALVDDALAHSRPLRISRHGAAEAAAAPPAAAQGTPPRGGELG
ncbi:MAG: tRNA uracil 4-sulfurtransferase ThiI [Armatimonadota bacterium]|nr:tRNA uracil 4-sulfurtransferase ThiI [Armatimonadota bacterium]MDR7451774.1 tRNA uracil 4-sulfurtransferase ThiI [Armatimonadota bacterium]MDR7467399.1 tRNA uracil 4-sulfurtransferase ThiI [Armatimonadota bacterium]MDR7494169.1 tRNA uracil 4-sulfurtransferase ThiI [Armatimonadota bacterium]MDR7498865.1 tRNA uracil 4-sulfurtransferase ThiI [Armatimonadota bacterium]